MDLAWWYPDSQIDVYGSGPDQGQWNNQIDYKSSFKNKKTNYVSGLYLHFRE